MYSIGKIISENRKKQNMSQIRLAEELNTRFGYEISNKSVSKWEKDSAEPSLKVFFSICRILRITNLYEEYFGENPDDVLSGLNEAGMERIYEYARLLNKDERYQKQKTETRVTRFRTIPLQIYPVSAGPGNFLDDENYEDMAVDEDVPFTADFAVRVSGDSMEPKLHKNQIIYVHKQNTLENGEIGIFFLDGEAYVKKFRKDETGTFLVSLNQHYAPMPVHPDSDFRIFGKLVH